MSANLDPDGTSQTVAWIQALEARILDLEARLEDERKARVAGDVYEMKARHLREHRVDMDGWMLG